MTTDDRRYDTDIRAGITSGIKTCLVESGCHTASLQSLFPQDRAHYVAGSVKDLIPDSCVRHASVKDLWAATATSIMGNVPAPLAIPSLRGEDPLRSPVTPQPFPSPEDPWKHVLEGVGDVPGVGALPGVGAVPGAASRSHPSPVITPGCILFTPPLSAPPPLPITSPPLPLAAPEPLRAPLSVASESPRIHSQPPFTASDPPRFQRFRSEPVMSESVPTLRSWMLTHSSLVYAGGVNTHRVSLVPLLRRYFDAHESNQVPLMASDDP